MSSLEVLEGVESHSSEEGWIESRGRSGKENWFRLDSWLERIMIITNVICFKKDWFLIDIKSILRLYFIWTILTSLFYWNNLYPNVFIEPHLLTICFPSLLVYFISSICWIEVNRFDIIEISTIKIGSSK